MHASRNKPYDYHEPAYAVEYARFRLKDRSRHASGTEADWSRDINVAFVVDVNFFPGVFSAD
jgi:hypothetical protein